MSFKDRYQATDPRTAQYRGSNRAQVTRLDIEAALESALITLRDVELNTTFKTGMAQHEIEFVLKKMRSVGYDYKTR